MNLATVWGLGTIFLASADERTLHGASEPPGAMDYSFRQGHMTRIGPYDRAAVYFAYSPDPEVKAAQLSKGFYYCSDEAVLSAKNPLCEQYDTARTTNPSRINWTSITLLQVNNLRLGRLQFGLDPSAYKKRVFALLLPLRLVYDNAQALLQAYAEKDYVGIWELAGNRVEADSESLPKDEVLVPIPQGNEVQVDAEGPLPNEPFL